MFELLKSAIQLYTGNQFWFILFVCCCFVGMIFHKKNCTSYFGWSSIIIIVVLCNPILISFLAARWFQDNRLSKLFCALPIYLVIALVLTRLLKKKWQLVLVCILFVVFGNWAISRANFDMPQNAYKIEQAAINVADFLEDDYATNPQLGQIKVLADENLNGQIRQYDPNIYLEFGRKKCADYDSQYSDFLYEMFQNNKIMDTYTIENLAAEDGCTYLAVYNDRTWNAEFTLYEYVDTVDGYLIYRRCY